MLIDHIDEQLLAELRALESLVSQPDGQHGKESNPHDDCGNTVHTGDLTLSDEESGTFRCPSFGSPSSSQSEDHRVLNDVGYRIREFVKKSECQVASAKANQTIAQLFPEATIMFADIAGFTAWSSIREADQVFTLLEAIFQAFDAIAVQHHVFKVETVGDCYVAVCGLPSLNKDHAIVMARFSRDCVDKFHEVIRSLEMKLGPDTGELGIRVGLNSGPVTAGVLRGDRARLQLFGDTVNTTARIETTSLRNRIHVSAITADLIKEAGHRDWVIPRDEIVSAKGKGRMNTYWLKHGLAKVPSARKSNLLQCNQREESEYERNLRRCVDWNTELLLDLLKKVIARRHAVHGRFGPANRATCEKLKCMARELGKGMLVVDEVANIIELPDFDGVVASKDIEIELPPEVVSQCHTYVARLASMYRTNPFHNFEHATHVTMSVYKLLSRIVAPTFDTDALDEGEEEELKHDHTYGITSDPLTQFSVVLSALMHDVDHRGVPNNVLMKEDKSMSELYHNKSIAEQNSVDIAWEALMSEEFDAFRACIFCDKSELLRFRQLLVNSVIATDIFDKEQSALRKNRWARAFSEDSCSISSDDSFHSDVNRKATIVIEHLIQASDVAHTMQHWHVYTKWNERLFQEMYEAYLDKRSSTDPSVGWYKGEIWFFDNYVIPLAKKLKNCGVFGVSSDEYLNYAVTNRNEWAISGEAMVENMKLKYSQTQEA